MNALTLLLTAMCVFLLAYRYYAAFIGAKVLMLNDSKITPAVARNDGSDFVPTNKWLVFGQHFAAIAGAGPLIGPILAAQFGWGPAFFWILFGSVFAGAVHDMIIIFASMRHNGESLAVIAKREVGQLTGTVTGIVILFISIITIAGVSLVVINDLHNNPWGVFSIAMTIPIAMLVGVYIFKIHPGTIMSASLVGIILVCGSVFLGPYVSSSSLAHWFTLSKRELSIVLPIYSFCVAALPVWLLLTPRGYLSTYMKLGMLLVLVGGVFIARPVIQMPFTTAFVSGGGPVLPGPCWPYVFITVACGAISGFHSLIGSGTTPKMIEKESHIPMVGYGSMLFESIVALVSLIAVVTLAPADYFAINSSKEAFASLNIPVVDLPKFSALIGLDIAHRPGGAISLAVGMVNIFSNISGWFLSSMKYWFQFMVMFEALFILTLIDAGAKVARYILQNLLGTVYAPMKQNNWLPGIIITSALVSLALGYLLYTGDISSIWPLFGSANQALASLTLAVGTSMILRIAEKKIYALITMVPCLFTFVTTLVACTMNIKIYFAKHQLINAWISIAIMLAISVIILDNMRCWYKTLKLKNSEELGCVDAV